MESLSLPELGAKFSNEDACHRGKRHGHGSGPYAAGNKTVIVGAVEPGGEIRLRVTGGRDRGTLTRFLSEVVDDKASLIYTDDWVGYRGVGVEDTQHVAVNH